MLVLFAVLARLLDPADFGIYVLSLSFVFIVALVAQLGVDRAIVRLVAESIELDRPGTARHLIFQGFLIVTASTIVVAMLVWMVLGPLLAKAVLGKPALEEVSGLLALWVAAFAFQGLIAESLRGFQDIRLATLFGGNSIGGLLSILAYFVALFPMLFLAETLSLEAALTLSVLANWLVVTAGIIVLFLKLRTSGSFESDGNPASALLATSPPLLISNLGMVVLGQADVWIVGAFRSLEEVAMYGAASRLIKILSMSMVISNEVIAPIIAQLNVRLQKAALARLTQGTAFVGTLIALPIFAAYALFGEELIGLAYGPSYTSGAAILIVLSLGQFVSVWSGPCGVTLMMTGHGRLMMSITVVTSVVGVLLAIAAVSHYGAIGVAWAVAITTMLQRGLLLLGVRARSDFWTYARPTMNYQELLLYVVSGIRSRSK